MVDKSKIKVEILKRPTEQDWLWCKECTLNTVGKKLKSDTKEVSLEWKKKLLASEHSPIRELWFGIKLTIPYFISVHIVRHHIGCNHFVSTQRDDRKVEVDVSREDLPQGTFVTHIFSVNASELMFFMRKRLCNQADPLMRYVAQMIKKEVLQVNPEFDGLLVPLCEYRNGLCTEMFPCARAKVFQEGKQRSNDRDYLFNVYDGLLLNMPFSITDMLDEDALKVYNRYHGEEDGDEENE